MKQKLILFLIAISCITCKPKLGDSMTNTKKEQISNKKYKWTTSGQADRNFPAYLHRASFYYDGGSSYVLGNRRLGKGWGTSGGGLVTSGPKEKPLPTSFRASWISLSEKKYYKGSFELPIKKIEKLFKEGYVNFQKEQETYYKFRLGLAPGGIIGLWISGHDRTIKIGSYQASEVSIDEDTEESIHIKDLMPSSSYTSIANYCDESYKYYKEKRKDLKNWEQIPFGLWDAYDIKYAWQPELVFKDKANLVYLVTEYYNGESYSVSVPDPIIESVFPQAVPKYFKLKWKNIKGDYFGARIYMDEEQIREAYITLFENPNATEAKLVFTVDDYNGAIKIVLKNEAKEITIVPNKIKIYDTEVS